MDKVICETPLDTTGSKYKTEKDEDPQEVCHKVERSSTIVTGSDVKERACDSLIMCIVTTLNQGLRNGGGIGDILRAPSSSVCRILCMLLINYS